MFASMGCAVVIVAMEISAVVNVGRGDVTEVTATLYCVRSWVCCSVVAAFTRQVVNK